MANTIFSKPVDYPTAKILEDKGYDKISQNFWHFNGSDCIEMPNKNSENFGFSAPTIGEVLEWLYENYGIWISVSHKRHSENKHFAYNIKQANGIETYLWEFNSPTEAYLVAIEYCLTNLI